MADVLQKQCDFKIQKGRKQVACGQPVSGAEQTPLTIDTTRYLMDLCDEHRQQLFDALLPWISVATDTQKRHGTHVRKALIGRNGQAFTEKDVRAWLKERGDDVSDTGRLSKNLIEEYQAAHGG